MSALCELSRATWQTAICSLSEI